MNRHARRGRRRGQAMIETALVAPVLMILVMAPVDVGRYTDRLVSVTSATRDGARYATTHSTAWSAAANANTTHSNTIEGVIQAEGGSAAITNDDAHITIAYQDSNGTACATYVAATPGLSYVPGWNSTNCIIPGGRIVVTVKYQYTILTPPMGVFFPNGTTMTSSYTMIETS